MFLCYRCYGNKFKEDKWDEFSCNSEVRDKCEDCGLVGIFVRDIGKIKEEI